ncbi:MAG: acyl carrier protein [uncultured bacterium]|nr:MAG: acyl carrier protein [uncultured bacterium]
MKGSLDNQFKKELKQLIIDSCDIPLSADDFDDTKPLFGPQSFANLDSLDALQIAMAVQKKYNVVINDSKELRRVSDSLNSFADFLKPE